MHDYYGNYNYITSIALVSLTPKIYFINFVVMSCASRHSNKISTVNFERYKSEFTLLINDPIFLSGYTCRIEASSLATFG